MAVPGLGFLRWGEPLVNNFAAVAEADDRGKAFAIEVRWPSREPDREPWDRLLPGHQRRPRPYGGV